MSTAVFAPDVPSQWAALVARVAALKRAEPLARVTVIVPGSALLEWCRRELGRSAGGTWLGVDVAPLFSFAARLTPEVREAPDEVLRLLLAARPLPEWIAAFDEPEASLLATFRDLDDAGFHAGLLEAADEALGPDLRTRQLFQTLAGLRVALDAAGLVTRADRLRLAAERYEAAPGHLLIYGLYDVTGAMAELLQAVLRGGNATIFLPSAGPTPENGPREGASALPDSDDYLRRIFDTFILPAVQRVEHAPRVLTAEREVRTIAVSGVRGELDTVVREIREALLAGASHDSLAVVGREIQSILPVVREAFGRAGIPLRAGRSLPGRAFGVVRGLTALLGLAERGLERAALFDAFRHGGRAVRLELGGWVGAFEAAVARAGAHEGEALLRLGERLVEGHALLESRSLRDADDEVPVALHAEAGRALGARVVGAARVLAAWPDETDVAGHHASLLALVRAVMGPPTTVQVSALESVKAALDATPIAVGRRAFVRAALRILDGFEVEEPPRGGVRVRDVMAARGFSFERLWLIGLDRRRWPRAIREDPLLPDAVRRRLASDLGLEALPVKERGYAEERLLFDHAVGAATRALTLVHQRSDDEGKAVAASPFLESVRAAHHVNIPRRAADALRQLAGEKRWGALVPRDLGLLAATELGLEASDTLVRVATAERRPSLAAALVAAQYRDRLGSAPGARDGLVGHGPGDALMRPQLDRAIAPTRVEALMSCPWRFFVERVLRVGATDGGLGLPEPDPVLVGNVTHAVHERLVAWLAGTDGADPLTWDDALLVARDAAGSELAHRAKAEDGGLGARLAVAVAAPEVAVRVEGLVEMMRGRFSVPGPRPEATEVHKRAALTLPSGRSVTIEARIDRVDRSPDGRRRYADLKTGKPEARELVDAVRRGRRLQAPFYTWLAEADAQEPSWVGFEFLPESGGHAVVGADVLDQQRLTEAARHVLELAVRLLEGGAFPLRRSAGCSGCDVTATCLRAHRPATRRLERLGQDAPLDDYGQLIHAYYRLADGAAPEPPAP